MYELQTILNIHLHYYSGTHLLTIVSFCPYLQMGPMSIQWNPSSVDTNGTYIRIQWNPSSVDTKLMGPIRTQWNPALQRTQN